MIGFYENRDFVPDIYANLKNSEKFNIFLSLYNVNVDEDFRVPYSYAQNPHFKCLKDIFQARAFDMLNEKKLKFYKNISFCCISSGIIAHFKNHTKFNLDFPDEPKYKVAKFIKTFYKNGEFSLIFNEDDLFCGYVFDKISRLHSDKIVYLKDGIISVKSRDSLMFNVVTSFKSVDLQNTENLRDDINFAFSKKSDCPMFLVFPRNNKFCKYKDIVSPDYYRKCVRLVPYSINNKIFIKGKK